MHCIYLEIFLFLVRFLGIIPAFHRIFCFRASNVGTHHTHTGAQTSQQGSRRLRRGGDGRHTHTHIPTKPMAMLMHTLTCTCIHPLALTTPPLPQATATRTELNLALDDDLEEQGTHDEDEEDDEEDTTTSLIGAMEYIDNNPHCNINFVQNTTYKFLAPASETRIFAAGVLIDPAPKVPSSRKDLLKDGDYVLVKSSSLVLKNSKANFEPQDELVLTTDWGRFDDDMTHDDLKDLEDENFLLWWQNIVPPPVPRIPRKPVEQNAKNKRRRQ